MASQLAILNSSDVSVDTVVALSLGEMGVRGVPTIVTLDNEGEVQDVWRGLLDNERKGQVLALPFTHVFYLTI